MNKKLIRLTESDFHRIVKSSVNKILRENMEEEYNSEYSRLKRLYQEFGKIYKDSTRVQYEDSVGHEDFQEAYLNVEEAFLNLFKVLREYGEGGSWGGPEEPYGA